MDLSRTMPTTALQPERNPARDRTPVTRCFITPSKTRGKRTAHHYAAHGVTRPLYRKTKSG